MDRLTFRAFIAVELDEGFRARELLPELERTGADIKLVEPPNIHATLKFLGETPEDLVDGIVGVMEASVKGISPFEVRFQGMGAFPNPRSIRVVWVGVQGAEPLGRMARALDEGLEASGFQKEARGFSPHITLGRVRTPRRWGSLPALLERYADTEFGSMRIERIALKKSVLGPRGPAYTTVREVELKG